MLSFDPGGVSRGDAARGVLCNCIPQRLSLKNLLKLHILGEKLSEFNLDELMTAPTKKSIFAKIAGLSAKVKIATAAALVVLVGGGGAFAYSAFNTPEAVVGLALASVFGDAHPSFEISADIQSSQITGTGTLDIFTADAGALLSLKATAKLGGQPLGATVNVISSKAGDVYANLSDFDSLGGYLVTSGLLPMNTVNSARTALLNTWVKISSADLNNFASTTTGSNSNDCLSSKLENPTYLTGAQSELGSALRNHNFIAIKKELPQVNGDRVFELGVNAEQLRQFLTAALATNYYRDLQTCAPGLATISSSDIATITQDKVDRLFDDGTNTLTTTLYANAFSHKLDKIEFIQHNAGTNQTQKVTFRSLGDQSSKVVIPTKSVNWTDLLNTLSGPSY